MPFFQKIKISVENLHWEKIFWVILAFALLIQFQSLSNKLYLRSKDLAFVSSQDNDSAAAIEVTLRTNLINDNGWRVYGPIYYKIASLFRHFNSPTTDLEFKDESKNSSKVLEKQTLFHLLTINLISIYLIGFILAYFFLQNLSSQLFFTYLFTPLVLLTPTRAELLFMAKPDWLFCFFLTWSFIYLWHYMVDLNISNWKAFSFLWGLTSATKLAVLFFVPSLAYFFLRSVKDLKAKSWIKPKKEFLVFISYFSLGYFILGLPQTWDIRGSLEYLLQQQKNITLGNLDFFKIWLQLFSAELKWVTLLILAFTLLLPTRAFQVKRSIYFQFSIFTFFALLFLTLRKINPPYDWYTFPITQVILVWFILTSLYLKNFLLRLIKKITPRRKSKLFYFLSQVSTSRLFFLALILVIPLKGNNLPLELDQIVSRHLHCLSESRTVETLINQQASSPISEILLDPYLPYDRQFHNKTVFSHWDMDLDRITLKTNLIGLKNSYYQVYLNQGPENRGHVVMHLKNIDKTKEFYQLFHDKSKTVDQLKQKWVKTHSDQCGFEVWNKIKD